MGGTLRRAARRARRPVGGALRASARVPPVVQLAAFLAFGALIPVFTSNGYVVRVAFDTTLYMLLAIGSQRRGGVGRAARPRLHRVLRLRRVSLRDALVVPVRRPLADLGNVPLVFVATVALGLLLSLTSRRLIGDYLAIVTLFFGQIFVTLTTQGYRLSLFGIGGTTTSPADRPGSRTSIRGASSATA